MTPRSMIYRTDGGEERIHTEAPSRKMHPPHFAGLSTPGGDEWDNGAYYGCLKKYESGSPLGGGPYAVLSITSTDETARHDWRDFQQLKNLLLGEEWEALELYPAESRLKDPTNRFYLWCFPAGAIPWGFAGRLVLDMGEAGAPQRPFPPH